MVSFWWTFFRVWIKAKFFWFCGPVRQQNCFLPDMGHARKNRFRWNFFQRWVGAYFVFFFFDNFFHFGLEYYVRFALNIVDRVFLILVVIETKIVSLINYSWRTDFWLFCSVYERRCGLFCHWTHSAKAWRFWLLLKLGGGQSEFWLVYLFDLGTRTWLEFIWAP